MDFWRRVVVIDPWTGKERPGRCVGRAASAFARPAWVVLLDTGETTTVVTSSWRYE